MTTGMARWQYLQVRSELGHGLALILVVVVLVAPWHATVGSDAPVDVKRR